MQALGADYGIEGEGEQAFTSLLEALKNQRNPGTIPGILARNNNPADNLQVQTPAKTNPAWGNNARPARQLFDYARYIRRGGTGNIQTKRGCVFKCSYCTYPLLEGNRFRVRDARDVVDEIEQLQRDYGPHPVFFVDSILNFPRGHVEGICEEILRRNLKVRWSCYATPVKLDRNQAQLMARAGCEGIELGTDAVDDEQLSRLGKSFDAATVCRPTGTVLKPACAVCHTLIFGAPGETESIDSQHLPCPARMRPTAVVAMTRRARVPRHAAGRTVACQGAPGRQ